MGLDIWKKDRSYQFGRMLAVMEYVERSAYSKEEEREPNAIRLQSAFNERPFHTTRVIEEQLTPYFARLKPGHRRDCRRKIEQIWGVISELTVSERPLSSTELNRPLEDTYLMGYYLQRADLYTKKEKTERETEDNEP